MKLRLSRQLHESARRCADAVGDSLGEWIEKAWRQEVRGRFDGVAIRENELYATRAGSTVVTVPAISGGQPEIRWAVARAVAYCQAVMPRPFETTLRQGKDYFVEDAE